MTVALHGVSANTPDRLVIDAGAVYYGWTSVASPGTLLGATKGGNVFELTRTLRSIEPDGAKGPVKGLRRLETVGAKLTVNLLEITEANLLKAIPGSAASSHVITGAEVDDDDYIDKIALVGTVTGFTGTSAPIVIELHNVLIDNVFTLNMNPKDEAVLQVVFTAHYANTDLDTEPWEIEYPSA
jgi:hypothetical protein